MLRVGAQDLGEGQEREALAWSYGLGLRPRRMRSEYSAAGLVMDFC